VKNCFIRTDVRVHMGYYTRYGSDFLVYHIFITTSLLVGFLFRAVPRKFRVLSGQFFAVSLDFRAYVHYANLCLLG
jgi:hypothetical protein